MQSCRGCSDEGGDPPVAGNPARVALLSPPGRGALAVVGVDGPGAVAMVSRVFLPHGKPPLAERAAGAIRVGRWTAGGEELVVVRRGETRLDVHCHGGVAAAEAVITSLESLGAVRQPWTTWLAAGGAGEIEIESREALARAGGPKAARILSRQLSGVLEAEIGRVRSLLADRDSAGESQALAVAAIDRLRRAARIGLRLVEPWRVVVAGPANAGKSSLVNALAGSARSIVSAEPGTTRDLLETRIVLSGWEIDLIDTAGLRNESGGTAAGDVEREGIRRAVAAAVNADLVLRVADGTQPKNAAWPDATGPAIDVLSKADCAGLKTGDPAGAIRTSSVTGEGIEELAALIARKLVPEEGDEPALLLGAVPFTPRQLAMLDALATGLPAEAGDGTD